MEIEQTAFAGVVLMRAEIHRDDRGSFERLWSMPELVACALATPIAQTSLARNPRAGTIRGLHYSIAPNEECKYVSCLAGTIFDVLVDLRPEQSTFGHFLSFALAADDGLTLRIPPGVAHGYQCTSDHADVLYHIDRAFAPAAARSIVYEDPQLAIPWPLAVTVISPRDAAGETLAAYSARVCAK